MVVTYCNYRGHLVGFFLLWQEDDFSKVVFDTHGNFAPRPVENCDPQILCLVV